jgi:competence protein ComFC
LCFACRLEPPRFVIRAATTYDGVIPPAVFRFKYAGRKSLAQPFGSLLRYAWHQYPELHDVGALIPVPLFARKERLRGYNQAELLAKNLSAEVSRPVLPLLVRTRKTPTQTSLNRVQRQTNLHGAFALHPYALARRDAWKGQSVLLIDDVATTTSTLQECAKVLHRAGIRTVRALVLARDL